jgi:hypothetical protein
MAACNDVAFQKSIHLMQSDLFSASKVSFTRLVGSSQDDPAIAPSGLHTTATAIRSIGILKIPTVILMEVLL